MLFRSFQISYPFKISKYRDIRHCWIIVNWQDHVTVRLVVVVRTTTVVPSVLSIVLRISVFSPFLRSEHFSIKSCVLIPLVTKVTAPSCCIQLHDSHLCAFSLHKDILLVEMRKAHFKVVLFFIINTILMLFHLYYCSIFCVMYPNSQTSWIISVMIALCFCFFAPFIYVWLFAILALFGKVYEHKGIKKFIKIVNNY